MAIKIEAVKRVLRSEAKKSEAKSTVKETIERKVKEFIDNRLADPNLSERAKDVYRKAREDSDKNP